MDQPFKETIMEEDFNTFLKEMSCLGVMRVSYEHRCSMARQVEDCKNIINIFNYFEMMYCAFDIRSKFNEIMVMCLFMLAVVGFLLILGHTVNTNFGPALKILSFRLHMNEYLAGATFLAFGNASPDLFANLMPIREDAAIFTITVGNAVSIILLSGATICFLRPFKMNGHSTVRDLLFMLLAAVSIQFVVFRGNTVTIIESLCLMAIYVCYLVINIVDLVLLRHTVKSIQAELKKEKLLPYTPERRKKIRKLQDTIDDLQADEKINIKEYDFSTYGSKSLDAASLAYERTSMAKTFGTPKPPPPPPSIDFNSTRMILHNANNPKNLFLISEFFETILPIDLEDWEFSNWFRRMYLLITSPIVFLSTICVPVVDYERDKHGWCKLLNCIQVVITPFIVISLTHSMISWHYVSWYLVLNMSYAKYSLLATVPLAVLVFFTSRTDIPPPYHYAFMLMSMATSTVIIMICSTEIEVLSSIVGIVFNMTANYMTITFGSIANATSDMIANVALAIQGYEKMAFAAILGGPFFNMLIGLSIFFLHNDKVREPGSSFWLYGEHGDNCFIFLILTIVCTLLWTLTFNFFARRSAAIFAYCLYFLFLLFGTLVEWDIIHEFMEDEVFEPR